ncbi:MAG: c-type cytochrome [Burkholderiales bacterium]
MKTLGCFAVGSAIAFAVGTAHAQANDPANVRMLASACSNCHGTEGRSQAAIPGLAGRSKTELVGIMKAFKDGSRSATIMHQIAKGYTDEQIDAISLYFSRIKP